MDAHEKKELTAADARQDNIFLKLKEFAKEHNYGTFQAEVKICDGRIVEIRHRDFVGVIR